MSIASGRECNASTTQDGDDCMKVELDNATHSLDVYTDAATKRMHSENYTPAVQTSFRSSQLSWTAYAKAECNAVYDNWAGGTVRFGLHYLCEICLTKARTHEVWANWLTSFGGAPPMLPEPTEDVGSLTDKAYCTGHAHDDAGEKTARP